MKVETTGAATKIDAIFRFDKDVWKGVQRGVKEAAELVAADARSRFPSYGIGGTSGGGGWGGWIAKNGGRNLGYDQSKIRSSVKTRFKSRYKSGFREVKGQAVVMNPAGAIYSLAGSQNKSGHHFNNVINTQHGSNIWPRALTPAYYAKGPQASREIGRVIEKAISNINQA
jgi:hypothetical protein